MSGADRDRVVQRAVDELRNLPRTDPAVIARVVAAAGAARVSPADAETTVEFDRARKTRRWMLVGVAAVAAFAGFGLSRARGSFTPTAAIAPQAASVASTTQSLELQPVASNAADALPLSKQFVFHRRGARNVSVVGDFNRWNPESARMTRAADGDLWSITVPVLPGRHMYGFMVDDSLFVLDPREPTGRDADLGVEASVIIVGRP